MLMPRDDLSICLMAITSSWSCVFFFQSRKWWFPMESCWEECVVMMVKGIPIATKNRALITKKSKHLTAENTQYLKSHEENKWTVKGAPWADHKGHHGPWWRLAYCSPIFLLLFFPGFSWYMVLAMVGLC